MNIFCVILDLFRSPPGGGGGGAELGLRYAKSRYVKFQLLKQWKFVIALSIA